MPVVRNEATSGSKLDSGGLYGADNDKNGVSTDGCAGASKLGSDSRKGSGTNGNGLNAQGGADDTGVDPNHGLGHMAVCSTASTVIGEQRVDPHGTACVLNDASGGAKSNSP